MSKFKYVKWFLVSIAVVILTACGGGGSGGDEPPKDELSTQEVALGMISQYAEDGSVIPTLQTYRDAGITGVTVNNIAVINTLVEALDSKDVNTLNQIQVLVDGYIASLIPDDDKAIVKLDTSSIEIKSLTGYTLSSSHTQVNVGNSDLNLSKDTKDVVALADDFGTPYLLGRKYAGETEVEVSLDSTAEMLVLSTAKFFGTNINNTKELSRRIRDHLSFENLKREIQFAIDSNSSCPLSFSCNRFAADYAVEIANDTKIEDL